MERYTANVNQTMLSDSRFATRRTACIDASGDLGSSSGGVFATAYRRWNSVAGYERVVPVVSGWEQAFDRSVS